MTNKEHPDFDGPKSKMAWNCPKIIFAFDRKFQNSKTKLRNDPTFWSTRSVWISILILRNFLQNCPRIIFAFGQNFQNSKTKLKNDLLKSKNTFWPKRSVWIMILILRKIKLKLPLKIQKPKKSLKSQNVRKQTLPSPTDSKTTLEIFKTQKSN